MIKILDILNELEINNPLGYKIKDWVEEYWGMAYDEVRGEIGEDEADAIYMAHTIINDINESFTKQTIQTFLNDNPEWGFTVDGFLEFLLRYDVIEKL